MLPALTELTRAPRRPSDPASRFDFQKNLKGRAPQCQWRWHSVPARPRCRCQWPRARGPGASPIDSGRLRFLGISGQVRFNTTFNDVQAQDYESHKAAFATSEVTSLESTSSYGRIIRLGDASDTAALANHTRRGKITGTTMCCTGKQLTSS